MLKKRFEEKNIDIGTQDINLPSETQFIVYNEMPKLKDIFPDKNNYLLIFESEVIRPDNWNIENHKYLKKIESINNWASRYCQMLWIRNFTYPPTILEEFYQPNMLKKIYNSIGELQYDLDKFLYFYNFQRTHQGYRTKGSKPCNLLYNGDDIKSLLP